MTAPKIVFAIICAAIGFAIVAFIKAVKES